MSFSGRQVVHYQAFSAKAANGVSIAIPCRDFRNCVLNLGTASSAAMTIKAQGAISSSATDYTAPDFSAAQTVTNNWGNVQMIDLNNGSPIDGTTGIVLTGTDVFKLYEINVNGLDFISFIVSGYSAGTATIEVQLTSNL